MSQENADERSDDPPEMRLSANKDDKLHDLQLRRDLAIINARTVNELGPLLTGGLPAIPRRKPGLAAHAAPAALSMANEQQENETMGLKSMAVAATMALAACTPVHEPSTTAGKNEDKPLRKLNPAPKQAYTITMTIENAPRPFAVVRGSAQYDVENHVECGRYLKFSGVYLSMTSLEDFPLTKVSDTEYQGTAYADLILDEDYFGHGVCRWKFTQAQVVLKATGADEETRFLPDLGAEAVYAQKSETRYFRKELYPRDVEVDRFPSFGQIDRSKFAPDISDKDLFAITLTSKEAQP